VKVHILQRFAAVTDNSASRRGQNRHAFPPPAGREIGMKRVDADVIPVAMCCEVSAALYSEAQFQDDLEVCNLSIDDMAAGLRDFKPLQVIDGPGTLPDRIPDGVVDPGLRRADDLDFLVRMMV
jgi:hypothetical protein